MDERSTIPVDQAFVGGTVVLPDELLPDAVVYCSQGIIHSVVARSEPKSEVSAERQIDCTGMYIAPGFVDLHVHGGDGADFMDGTLTAVQTACRAHLRHGTTTIFPTSTTGSTEQIMAMLAACRQFTEANTCPNIPGIHLYGPYFAEDKVGCHSAAGRRQPIPDEYERYFESGMIKIATCAAELQGAEAFYRRAALSKCLITCGHSNSSWNEMQAAYDLGMRHVDHFWCAMSSVPSLRGRFGVPMQASMAEFVLMRELMSTEVIADGFHLSPELLEFALQMIGVRRLCLVTDCNRALDMPAGKYRFGNNVNGSWLVSDGQVGWAPDMKSLASSVQGMDHMVRHMVRSTSASLADAVRMASLTPAERAGVSTEVGSLETGKRADILILDSQLKIQQIYCQGKPCDEF